MTFTLDGISPCRHFSFIYKLENARSADGTPCCNHATATSSERQSGKCSGVRVDWRDGVHNRMGSPPGALLDHSSPGISDTREVNFWPDWIGTDVPSYTLEIYVDPRGSAACDALYLVNATFDCDLQPPSPPGTPPLPDPPPAPLPFPPPLGPGEDDLMSTANTSLYMLTMLYIICIVAVFMCHAFLGADSLRRRSRHDADDARVAPMAPQTAALQTALQAALTRLNSPTERAEGLRALQQAAQVPSSEMEGGSLEEEEPQPLPSPPPQTPPLPRTEQPLTAAPSDEGVVENLRRRFPSVAEDDLVAMLAKHGGHAGRASMELAHGSWTGQENHQTLDELNVTAFANADGARVVLERMRLAPPKEAAALREVLVRLSTPRAIRIGAIADPAAAARYETLSCYAGNLSFALTILFEVAIVGCLIYGFGWLASEGRNNYLKVWAEFFTIITLSVFGGLFALMLLVLPLATLLTRRYQRSVQSRLDEQDKKVAASISDGTLRLLSVAWMRTCGLRVIARMQELPAEAFLPPADAAHLYRSRLRKVGVLSYRWLRPEHPDPCGQRLDILRAIFEGTSLRVEGLFWDFASLPQKGAAADGSIIERTSEEAAAFKCGLGVMGNLYAALESTTVLQLTAVPPPPDGYSGAGFNLLPYHSSGWCNFEGGAATLVVSHMEALRNKARLLDLLNGVIFDVLHNMLASPWALVSSAIYGFEYFSGGDPPEALLRRKWARDASCASVRHRLVCCGPMGARIERQLDESVKLGRMAGNRMMLEALEHDKLDDSRHFFAPKLVEISAIGQPTIVDATRAPALAELRERVRNAKFTGKGDHEMVMKMLDDFDADMGGRRRFHGRTM